MKKKNLQFCTASAAGEFDTAAALKTIREAGTTFQTCISGMEGILDEPLKSKFSDVNKQIVTMLAGLPSENKAPDGSVSKEVVQSLLGVLATAQAMVASLNETAKSSVTELASTKASLTGEVEKAIAAKITSGDLITKDQATKNISDATAAAVTSARAAAVTELKTVSDRRLALTTAGLPIPADEILAVADADFKVKQDAAAKRAADLKQFSKLKPERVLALCWNTDEPAYQESLTLMKDAFEAGGGSRGANGFSNRSAENKPSVTSTMLC